MSDLIKSIPDGWKNEQGFVKKASSLYGRKETSEKFMLTQPPQVVN